MKEEGYPLGYLNFDNNLADIEKKESAIRLIGESDANVKFTVFLDHSVVPEGIPDIGLANHMNTWPEVYSYVELKRWLFRQRLI